MKLVGVKKIAVPGWLGGVREDIEPDAWDPRKPGILDRGLNFVPIGGAKLAVRGGSAEQLTFAEQDISQVLGVWPFSPTGALAITFSAVHQKHYAYALTDQLAFALPSNSTPSESGSRVELGAGWATAGPGRPNGEELFEKLYIADASLISRRPQVAISVAAGALVATTTSYNLDGVGGNDAPMKPYCLAVFASVVFSFGWGSEADSFLPHLGRHSFLGIDPVNAAGYDKDAYNTFGAQGQTVTAAKAGNTILLVAKANELYRVTGSGRGLPGWQFPFQPLNDSEGRGCANPDALAHVDGKWYGAGAAGPFITDGVDITDIQPSRRRSWASVDQLTVAWVRPHPDRQAILFGFHVAGSPSRPNFPFEMWWWDLVRQTWAPNQRYPQTFHMVSAIASGISSAPADIPSSPSQSFDFGEFEFAYVSGTFDTGDVAASTEVWGRQADGSTTLLDTLPAGVQRFRVAAGVSKITFIKLRHVKGGTVGDFSGEASFYTRLLAPQVAVGTLHNDGPVRADYLNYVPGVDLLTFDSSGFSNEYDAIAAGPVSEFDLPDDACYVTTGPDQGALYWAQVRHPDWPLAQQLSAQVECHTLAHKCTGDISTLAPEPRQRLEQGGMQLTSITLNYFPARSNTNVKVQYRSAAGGNPPWSDGTTLNSGTDLALQEVTITGLLAQTAYEVRLVNVTSGQTSVAVRMYTQLDAPTINAALTAGTAGSPVVNLQVTPALPGLDLFLYNAAGTFQALHLAVVAFATYQSTFGICGTGDRYFARTRNTDWPDGWQFSEADTADVDDPCTVGS